MPKPSFPNSEESFGEFILQLLFYIPMLLSYLFWWGGNIDINSFALLFQTVLGGIQLISGISKAIRYRSTPHQIYCCVVLAYILLPFVFPFLEPFPYNKNGGLVYLNILPTLLATSYLFLTKKYITKSPRLDA